MEYCPLRLYAEGGNGKTEFAAILVLYFLIASGKRSIEVYSAAGDKDQAARIFKSCKQILEADDTLYHLCKITDSKKKIEVPHLYNTYEALSADIKKSGRNPSIVICDEIHEWERERGKALWEQLSSGSHARKESLQITLTTAGVYDPQHFACNEWDYAKKVQDNPKIDPTYHAKIYCAEPADNWEDEKVWKKANPSIGITFDIEKLRAEYTKAKRIRSEEIKFKRYYLNLWTNEISSFFDANAIKLCKVPKFKQEDINGEIAYVGCDLGFTTDICSLAVLLNTGEGLKIKSHNWIPEHKAKERSDQVNYYQWEKEGWITFHEGKTIKQIQLFEEIQQILLQYNVSHIGFDKFNAKWIAERLEEEGYLVFGVPPYFKNMNEPLKELERLILDKRIEFDSPVLEWMFNNVSVETDSLGNIRPTKKKSKDKIDGVMALLNAMFIFIGEGGLNSERESSGFGQL